LKKFSLDEPFLEEGGKMSLVGLKKFFLVSSFFYAELLFFVDPSPLAAPA
jgi:hypothetical protein